MNDLNEKHEKKWTKGINPENWICCVKTLTISKMLKGYPLVSSKPTVWKVTDSRCKSSSLLFFVAMFHYQMAVDQKVQTAQNIPKPYIKRSGFTAGFGGISILSIISI